MIQWANLNLLQLVGFKSNFQHNNIPSESMTKVSLMFWWNLISQFWTYLFKCCPTLGAIQWSKWSYHYNKIFNCSFILLTLLYKWCWNFLLIIIIIPYLYSILFIPCICSKVLYISNSLNSCTNTHVEANTYTQDSHSHK